MWLSEALILGRALRRKCRHVLFGANTSCAMGAVIEALGYVPLLGAPLLTSALIANGDSKNRATIYALEHMNDTLDVDAEYLADWLKRTGRDFEIRGRFVDNVWEANVETDSSVAQGSEAHATV